MNSWWTTIGFVLIGIAVISAIYIYCNHMTSAELKCVVSTIDGEKYCVRRREKLQEAADLLAVTVQKISKFIEHLQDKYPDRDDVKQLVRNFDPKKVEETLPTSKYTAYTENKKKMAFCLNVQNENNEEPIDEETLLFVALHEVSHCANATKGHDDRFWSLFRFVLQEAEIAGIYKPVDYSKTPQQYCGMKINSNPYFDKNI